MTQPSDDVAERPSEPAESEPDRVSFFRRGRRKRLQPAAGLSAGKVVGDFQLVELIGQGGMGEIWEAEQLSLGRRRVAVKFVRPDRVTERQLELFAREARAGGRLHHPGIVTLYAHGSSDGLAWIAMEFVEGAWTLRDFLDEVARLGEVPEDHDRQVARLVAEIAEAIQVAHDANVIHRDVKPQNLLITADGRPKVTDFGLARITDEAALTMTGEIAGTYCYMSPEQVVARRMGIDHRTDIFSLGVVLYELLALQRPFRGDTEHQVAEQIVTKDPPDPRTIRSRVPRDLVVIAGRALEKDRDKRFQTMRDFAADLRRFLAHEPVLARPPSPVDRAVKWVKRNRTFSTAAAIAAAAFVAISVLLLETLRARNQLWEANQALSSKTAESEARREQAELNEQRADHEAETASRRAEEVLRLSALQRLDDLVAGADRLWPAHPENLERYAAWLREAGELVDELPAHQAKLAELRAKSVPRSGVTPYGPISSHPKLPELESARRRLAFFRAQRSARQADRPVSDPLPEEVGVDIASLPADPAALNQLAWSLIDPDRAEWGGEAKGLVLARRAVERAAELTPPQRAELRDTLAWALFANGRFEESLAESGRALDEAPPERKQEFEGYLARLRNEIEDPARQAQRAADELALERKVAELERDITDARERVFADARDKWWHNQLEKLVAGLEGLADPETGLVSGRPSPEQGWSISKREAFARTIRERSISGADAEARWTQAIASIADSARCPRYGGLRIEPQLGLLPVGRDPASGLWEFAHLQTGEPAERGDDGRLRSSEETGLVFVLVPGGRFLMGAQRADPTAANFDPHAHSAEGPVLEVEVAPFFLSKYELTQAQWLRVTGENPSGYSPEDYSSNWNREGAPGDLLHPVEQVSWVACSSVLGRLGLELPSEAQWEYGARAGTTTVWWCGDDTPSIARSGNVADGYAKAHGGVAWQSCEDWDDGHTSHAPVGRFAPNDFGLHDTIGNVCEWCLDRYLPDAAERVARGGSFGFPATSARSADRGFNVPDDQDVNLGVRPARALAP